MDFAYSERVEELRSRLLNFFDEHIHANDKLYHHQLAEAPDRWQPVPVVEELKPKARAAGLWNLFLPHSERGAGLTNLEYAPLAEIMGGVPWSSEVFNCSAPDTGNMETIDRYGTEAQKRRWLDPLLDGEIRSCCSAVPNIVRISMLPVSGAEQFVASDAIGDRPMTSASGAYSRLVKRVPGSSSFRPGRNRFHRPSSRARALRPSRRVIG